MTIDVRADSSDRRFRNLVITRPPNENALSTSMDVAKVIKGINI